ncbi:ABC transporter ATP-binding protein [Citricoccus sp. NR2]|uniref:ABC transporter ATP-binding protein n=1 Tax=Citricoccus sp. NR2 TaxID=3004095 RepID=UPI0022DCF389|nr:ABC transporter ATP-binding protein [Citricoccus sp. NR2]WBL20223.1 ABC transporter ATP-binding protein [Citricoccus sp. NR2]
MSAPAVECQQVSITYPDGFTAVQDIDLAVAPGEIVALLGPSGSGKSTLLRGLAGLERITSGRVLMDDVVVDGPGVIPRPVHQRGCGMVFQDGQLFPHRTVGRNISYGLEASGMPKPQRRERVAEMLELVSLEGFENRPVTTLSGGQGQRVALARSLAPRPKLLLLDEPLSALDRDLRERLAVDIRQILTSTSIAAVFVTHDHDEAATVADRIVTIDAGRIITA